MYKHTKQTNKQKTATFQTFISCSGPGSWFPVTVPTLSPVLFCKQVVVYRCCLCVCIYQCGDAQQDDEDDEGLKESELNDMETNGSDLIPDPPCSLGRVYVLDGAAAVTAWNTGSDRPLISSSWSARVSEHNLTWWIKCVFVHIHAQQQSSGPLPV